MEMERRPLQMNVNALAPSSPASSTTFVQADATTFRELVQKLTGLAPDSENKLPVTLPARLASKPANPITSPRRSPFKLQERRHTMRKLEIKLSRASLRNSTSPCSSPCYTHLVESPIASPVTPLRGSESPYFFSSTETSPSSTCTVVSEEERAIAEKRFYLHPSPLSTPRGSEPPELLPLFPLSSPALRS